MLSMMATSGRPSLVTFSTEAPSYWTTVTRAPSALRSARKASGPRDQCSSLVSPSARSLVAVSAMRRSARKHSRARDMMGAANGGPRRKSRGRTGRSARTQTAASRPSAPS